MKQSNFRRTLMEDIKVWNVPVSSRTNIFMLLKYTISLLIFAPGFSCVFWYRINRKIRRFERTAKFLHALRYYTFANDISYHASIGPGFKVCHASDVVIGANAKIGKNFQVFNGVTIGSKGVSTSSIKPTIGDNVYIGTGAKVLGGITIGNDVIIGAITFCDQSVPNNMVAFGNPMRLKDKKR